jgi:hypothetical protein
MGTKISSEVSKEERKERKPQVISQNISPITYDSDNPFSSYEGLKSVNSKEVTRNDTSFSPNNSRLTTSSVSDDLDDPLQKVPTKFIWRGGGHTVYVTGSFANWKQWFLMSRTNVDSQEFTLSLDLPRGTYQFKFIVDKVWKFSPDLPQIKDEHCNTNNIINNSEIFLKRRQVKEINVKCLLIIII